jgi:hypothetical protein
MPYHDPGTDRDRFVNPTAGWALIAALLMANWMLRKQSG